MENGDGAVSTANGDRKRKSAAAAAEEDGRDGKRRGGWGRGKGLEGRYLWKEFPGMGVYLGKVVRFDQGLYRVCYEDGDAEDLEFREIRRILIAKAADFGSSPPLAVRKEKLDYLAAGTEWNPPPPSEPVVSPEESSVAVSGMSSDVQSESEVVEEEDEEEDEVVGEVAALPEPSHPALPLALPPSSGGLGVPEEAVSYLFSVYNFLRSFSNLIFLSPFSLDCFVGSLNCNSQNTLLDAVHVCLMRALWRHLQTLSSDGDELASKCLRSVLSSSSWKSDFDYNFNL